MRFIDEYRDPGAARRYTALIRSLVTRPWRLMELCGGQTHTIVRFGLEELLPAEITLVHGPGCPVCVTPASTIDKAIAIAARPEVTLCTFGDMLRVPGSTRDLSSIKAEGADVRLVYSPMDAVGLAEERAPRQVVFLAVGFETTAPANAMAAFEARRRKLSNFSLLVSQVTVPPAIRAIAAAPETRVDGFLAAGHVCTVMGLAEYEALASELKVPIVVTGFEPLDILQGVAMCVRQLEEGRAVVDNTYDRSVRAAGNEPAQRMLREVFQTVTRPWRGMGDIPASGLSLRPEYADLDAERRFEVSAIAGGEDPDCKSGLVLRGLLRPPQCPAFGSRCTPERPLGATMVSSEGACAAYFRYRRFGGAR